MRRMLTNLTVVLGTVAITSALGLMAAQPASAHETTSATLRSHPAVAWSKPTRLVRTSARVVRPAAVSTATTATTAGSSLTLKGAQVHVLWDASSPAEVDRQLGLLTGLGANTARVDVAWASLQEQGPDSYSNWYVERLDSFVSKAVARGIRPLITLDETPCWASSAPESLKLGCSGEYWERRTQDWAPTNASDFARAAAWVAKRYSGRIAGLELWNEPNYADQGAANLRTEGVGLTKAVAYARMVEAAYPAVKAVAPSLPVIAGALSYADTSFYAAAVAAGMRSFDAVSVHPYTDGRSPDAVGSAQWRHVDFAAGMLAFRAKMVALGHGNRDVWITEAGWTNCVQAGNTMCISETNQAAWTARSVSLARSWSWMTAFYAYTLLDGSTDRADSESNFGLVRTSGAAKPVYGALRTAFAAA